MPGATPTSYEHRSPLCTNVAVTNPHKRMDEHYQMYYLTALVSRRLCGLMYLSLNFCATFSIKSKND